MDNHNEIKIIPAENGWTIEWWEQYTDSDKYFTQRWNVSYNDDENPDIGKSRCEALRGLFYQIKQLLGEFYNKHREYNVVVNLEKNGKIVEIDFFDK